jgi:hypothetical protein
MGCSVRTGTMCVARLMSLTILDRGEKYLRNATLDLAGTKTRRRQGRSVFMDNATLEYEGEFPSKRRKPITQRYGVISHRR